MATIAFTPHLRDVGPTAPTRCDGVTLAEVLETVGRSHPRLLGYVFDDQGRLRKHIAVFIDGVMRSREAALTMPLTETSDIYIFQALSGG